MTKEEKAQFISELSITKVLQNVMEKRKAYIDDAKNGSSVVKKVSDFVATNLEKKMNEFISSGVFIFGIVKDGYDVEGEYSVLKLNEKEFAAALSNIWLIKAALNKHGLVLEHYASSQDEKTGIDVALIYKVCEKKYKRKKSNRRSKRTSQRNKQETK